MDFRLTTSDRDQLTTLQRDLVLAEIMRSGEIRIRVADARDYPGHLEWLRRDAISRNDVLGGFSVKVDNGYVSGIFSYSRLNRADPPCLTEDQIAAIEFLLPLAPTYKVYR